MRTLYEAASAIEAHMLVDLLKREGMTAYIHGEHLQGAVGELPPGNLVRLVIDEADYERARAVIGAWESEQPADPTPMPPRSRSRVGPFVAGLSIGIILTVALYRTPVSADGTDLDGDGLLEETWTYGPTGRPSRYESDRNLDHKIDFVLQYDRRGLPAVADSDNDFNGIFETHARYRDNQIESTQIDTDDDGFPDRREHYTNGVLDSMEFIDPRSHLPRRIEHYKLGTLLLRAEIDSDLDGTLDKQLIYSSQGEVVETRRLQESAPSP